MHFFIPGQRDEWARLCWLEHAFSEEECEQIIQLAKDVEKQWTTTGDNISAIEFPKSEIDGLEPFCYIDFEARRNELHIHTFAAYPEQVTMIKTQSLFDFH